MSLNKMILSRCLLALTPLMLPSLMHESYVHPSIQVPNLSNETTTIILSPVDFVGTVETESVVPTSSPIDTIQVSSNNSFGNEVKAAAILAAKDFCNDVFAKLKLVGEKSQTFINELVSDTLVTLEPFGLATTDAIGQMSTIFERFRKQLRAVVQDFMDVINSTYYEQLLMFKNENFGTFIRELKSLAPRTRSDIPSFSRNIFNKIPVDCQVAYKNLGSSTMALFTARAPEPSTPSFAIQLQAIGRFGRRISQKSQLVYHEQLGFLVANDWFSPVPARPASHISFVIDSSIIADAVQTSAYSAALFQAYIMKLKSLVFPAPDPAPTTKSLESIITRDVLDKKIIALEFQQQRFNEKMLLASSSFLNDLLLAPVTTPSPPSSFCIQLITAAYNKLEAFVTNLFFFGPPPPPPRTTFQSIARYMS